MPYYHVRYAHENDREEAQYGWGEIDIETDWPVVSEPQKLEVARAIGKNGGHTKVVIQTMTEKEGPIAVD